MPIKPKKLVPVNEKKQVTRVALVVDRSGSMVSVQKEALSGLNEQINALRSNADKTETYVTLIQFDSEIETLFDRKAAQDLEDRKEFIPRGSTSLYDAVGTAIAGLKAAPVGENDDVGYLVVVISDGEENTSREYTQKVISDEIKALEATGDWTFTFMLANQDIHKAAKNLNVSMGNVHLYCSTGVGTAGAFTTMATSTGDYMTKRGMGVKSVNNFYQPTTTDATIVNNPTLSTPDENTK